MARIRKIGTCAHKDRGEKITAARSRESIEKRRVPHTRGLRVGIVTFPLQQSAAWPQRFGMAAAPLLARELQFLPAAIFFRIETLFA